MKPYIQRMIEERDELTDRMDKLRAFRTTALYNQLDEVKQRLLDLQLGFMESYAQILKIRLYIELHTRKEDNE